MVNASALHPAPGWLAPGPMWGAYGNLADAANLSRFGRPVILRYAGDSFMDELTATLALQPEQLAAWQARWESWEQPMTTPVPGNTLPLAEPLSRRNLQLLRGPVLAGKRAPTQALVSVSTPVSDKPLKLYQPVQNRFYLVSASLVCHRAGLPDRHIDPGKQEQAGFVLRRLIPPDGGESSEPSDWDEYAYAQGLGGPRWQKADKGATLALGEERLPLFSLAYTDAKSHPRRIFAGLVPVGRREAYLGAAFATPADPGGSGADPGPDTRELLFALQVTGPWRELVANIQTQRGKFNQWDHDANDKQKNDASFAAELKSARERVQTASWYIALDFVRFLQTHISPVWEVLSGSKLRSDLSSMPKLDALLSYVEQIVLTPDLSYKTALLKSAGSAYSGKVKANLANAMAALAQDQQLQNALEDAVDPFSYGATMAWPAFLFPLADPDETYGPCPLVADGIALFSGINGVINQDFNKVLSTLDGVLRTLTDLVKAALPDRSASPQPDIRIPKEMEHVDVDAWFTIRCVYERPNCGCLQPPVLSAPTEAFQMASFFDPDAPARQVRIPMPVNISPAALRKYNKSATMVVSDMLCGQLKRIRQLSLGDLVLSVLPWPFHKDLPSVGPAGSCNDGANFGMLCSLSIPIVTLCALILLLIIVALFDLFFRWIPLLFLCFPIPGLGSKK